jgi:hypothetical protein
MTSSKEATRSDEAEEEQALDHWPLVRQRDPYEAVVAWAAPGREGNLK